MKKITIILGLFTSSILFGQQNATNNNPSVPAQNGTNDRAFWSRSGNTPINGNNNIFGTLWNSPIYTKTNGIQRQILMGSNPAGSVTGSFGLGTVLQQSFMHLSNFDNSLFTSGSGKLFRTDGLSTFNNE